MKKLTLLLLLMISTNIQADNTPDWEKKCKPCSSLKDDVTFLCSDDKSRKVCFSDDNYWIEYETFKERNSDTSSSKYYTNNYLTNVGVTLTSGITNILFGVVEIPKTIIIYNKCDGLLKASTVGFIQGIGKMGLRTFIGFFDTFMFLLGDGPHIRPIYIWNNFDIKTGSETGEINETSKWVCDKK